MKTQKRFSLDGETVTRVFKDFFFYTGEITRFEFSQRIIYVAGASFVSLFWFAIPFLHSLFLLGTVASLASLVVRRLRNLNYHWALVFLGLLPFLGWIAIAVFAVLKPRSQDDDGVPLSKIALSAGATFIACGLLIASLSINSTERDQGADEAAQSLEVADQEQIAAEEAAEAEAQEALEAEAEARLAEEAAKAEEEAEAKAEAQAQAKAEEEAQANSQSFEEIIAGLVIQPEVVGGYDRDLFRHWIDADGDGCDTRREVLIAESTTPVTVGSRCSLSGGTWVSAFDGVSTIDSSTFDVDHLVPLAEAWRSGAHAWDSTTRQNFANDLGYEMALIAVSASSNRSKSDRDPSGWMPRNAEFKCEYVYSWIQVKLRWKLSIDSSEANALRSNWSGCAVEELEFKAEAAGATIKMAPAPAPKSEDQQSATPDPAPEPDTSGCVNINTASFEELRQIKHIDVDRANQILSLRPFSSVDSMTRIKGIAEKRLAEIKAQGLACVG